MLGNTVSTALYSITNPRLASCKLQGLHDKEIIFGPGDVSSTLGAILVEVDYMWRQSISVILTAKDSI